MAYRDSVAFAEVDACLAPSQFLAKYYRDRLGLEAAVLPPPILEQEAIVPPADCDPVFATFVNPSLEKGLMVFARVAEMIGCQHPGVPLLTVESRVGGGELRAAGQAGGFELSWHENLMFMPSTPDPRNFLAVSRVLVVPSLLEAAGRVVAEAQLNGIPCLVSDRGGLSEMQGEGGLVIPLPRNIDLDVRNPVDEAIARPWVDAIVELSEEPAWELASKRAKLASERFKESVLVPQYEEWFRRQL